MKKLLFLISICLLHSFQLLAQTDNSVGKIALSVVMPDNVEGLSSSNLSKLETKIIEIIAAKGLASTGYNNNFVIYPKFSIYESTVVESGLKDITVNECDLSLFIKQVDTNVIFASVTKSLKGNWNNKQTAITNAISKINVKDVAFQDFVDTGKGKIISYYEMSCGDIINKADGLIKRQQFDQAIGLLMTVPEEVSCFSKVKDKSIEAYLAYQKQKCSESLQLARTQLAANDYNMSLTTLSTIDPSTPCFNDSQKIIAEATSKLDEEERRNWAFLNKVYDDNVALEKLRINAVKEIATAYYQSQPTTITYSTLILY